MAETRNEQTLDQLLAEAESRPLIGWDLSYDGRITIEPLPWDFAELVSERARQSPDLLDLGTGGGEWLSQLPYRPARTVATEGWPPNIPVAGRRLHPLGVSVVGVTGAPDNVLQHEETASGRLPFADGSFHLISNRHESYIAAEVARVLAPGGHFLTQQVAGSADDDFYDLLGLSALPLAGPAWTLSFAVSQIEAAGLTILTSAEAEPRMTFADIGALAWYLKVIPWTLPGFAIADHCPRLADLHNRVRSGTSLSVRLPHFWLEAALITPDRNSKMAP